MSLSINSSESGSISLESFNSSGSWQTFLISSRIMLLYVSNDRIESSPVFLSFFYQRGVAMNPVIAKDL